MFLNTSFVRESRCTTQRTGNTHWGLLVVLLLLSCSIQAAHGQPASRESLMIDSVGGTGEAMNNGNGETALKTNIGDPFGVELGPDGALYVCEVRNHRIRRIDLVSGAIKTIAGTGTAGYSGDGGLAVEAQLNEPYEIRFDWHGNLYVVEMQNHVVRRINADDGTIETIAGTGESGYGGDNGPALEAKLNRPHSIALYRNQGLFVADIGNHRIRYVDFKTGLIISIAGSEERRLPVDGQRAKDNPILGPRALYFKNEVLWIALREGHSVWRMDMRDGVLHHVAGTGEKGFSGDGGDALDATFRGPKGIAVGPYGNIYVVDTENHAIRRILVDEGIVETVAGDAPNSGGTGDGGQAIKGLLDRPHGICLDDAGVIYIGDTLNHRIRRVKSGEDED